MNAVRLTVSRILTMKPVAWKLFLRCLQLCAVLLLGAIVLLIGCGGDTAGHIPRYIQAVSLYETGETVLLIAIIVPACLEEALPAER